MCIKINQTPNYVGSMPLNGILVDISTTKGYVYLASTIFLGLNYANKTSRKKGETSFYLFKLDIDDNELLADGDEMRMHKDEIVKIGYNKKIFTAKKSIELFNSVQVSNNISLKSVNAQYLKANSFSVEYPDIDNPIFKHLLKFRELKYAKDSKALVSYTKEFENEFRWNDIN